jgi:hypothetical protein
MAADNGLHVAAWTSSVANAAPVVGKVSENLGVELKIEVLADEGDDAIDASDRSAAFSRSVTLPAAARITKSSDTTFTDAGINAMLRDAVRDALAAGHTKLRLRLSLPTRSDGLSQSPVRLDIATSLPEAETKYGVPTGSAGLTRLTVAPKASLQTGFLFDLFDAKGSLLAQARTSADIRRLDAGEYLLRVYTATATANADYAARLATEPQAFKLDFDLPAAGQIRHIYELDDRDWITGGDGDDLIVGGPDIDRIVGGSGTDTFVADVFPALTPNRSDANRGIELRESLATG